MDTKNEREKEEKVGEKRKQEIAETENAGNSEVKGLSEMDRRGSQK